MGSLTLQYPPMTGGDAAQQLDGLRRYLVQLTDELNGADWSAGAVLTQISQAIDASALSKEERLTELSGFAALKTLIIKTADFAAENSEAFKLKLSGNYVAVSDFGKYWREASMTIDGNEFGIRQLYEFSAGVNNAFTVNSKQYVKTGLLYYDGVKPVYGVGVGNIETTVSNENEVIDKTKNELLTVTSGRVSFWQGGDEVAYLSEKKLHFPSGTLEAFDAKLTGTVTAAAGSSFGPWSISESSIYRTDNTWGGAGLYFGTDGLSIGSAFKVDSTGKLTATGADITGSIKASDLLLNQNGSYTSIQMQLSSLIADVQELTALAASVSTNASGALASLDLNIGNKGWISITGASSAASAVELYSYGAVRIIAGSGDVYIQNGDDSAHVQIAGSGAVSIKGTSLTFNGASINTSGNATEDTEEGT
nr:MAG TPA: hypothetical protein [Bacteriophage sp.]